MNNRNDMESIAFFTMSRQKARKMLLCIIIASVITLYQLFLHGYLGRHHDGVLAIALFQLCKTSFFPFLLSLLNLTCVCYMYDALRQSVKNYSATMNKLCWILIVTKVLNLVHSFFYTPLNSDIWNSNESLYTIIGALFKIVCFVIIFWLCVCLIKNFVGRIRTLGIIWMVALLLPQITELFFILIDYLSDRVTADFCVNILLSIFPYIYLVCAVIPLIFIYRSFKIALS